MSESERIALEYGGALNDTEIKVFVKAIDSASHESQADPEPKEQP